MAAKLKGVKSEKPKGTRGGNRAGTHTKPQTKSSQAAGKDPRRGER